jgi:hypothetical protein
MHVPIPLETLFRVLEVVVMESDSQSCTQSTTKFVQPRVIAVDQSVLPDPPTFGTEIGAQVLPSSCSGGSSSTVDVDDAAGTHFHMQRFKKPYSD